jgi:hypothetical protein
MVPLPAAAHAREFEARENTAADIQQNTTKLLK